METNANKMSPRSLHAMRRFTCVYLHDQTAVYTHLINHGYFDHGKKPEYPQLALHARIKMAQVLGSPVYIFELAPNHGALRDMRKWFILQNCLNENGEWYDSSQNRFTTTILTSHKTTVALMSQSQLGRLHSNTLYAPGRNWKKCCCVIKIVVNWAVIFEECHISVD